MPQNFYEVLWIFIIYAFIGWCAEVSYAAVNRGIFEWTILSNLWMRSSNCCYRFNTSEK